MKKGKIKRTVHGMLYGLSRCIEKLGDRLSSDPLRKHLEPVYRVRVMESEDQMIVSTIEPFNPNRSQQVGAYITLPLNATWADFEQARETVDDAIVEAIRKSSFLIKKTDSGNLVEGGCYSVAKKVTIHFVQDEVIPYRIDNGGQYTGDITDCFIEKGGNGHRNKV